MYQKINGIDLYYTVKGNGYPLIMLHGNGENLKIYNELAHKLKDIFTVYQIDSRGHGKSEKTTDISYDLMQEDLLRFIRVKKINKPLILGFSDGAIVGTLLAIRHSNMIMGLISCGANINPFGLKLKTRLFYKALYKLTRDEKYEMMLCEPDISDTELKKIDVPVMIVAGENDVIKRQHTEYISSHIKDSELRILPKQSHSSYIVNSLVMYPIIIQFVKLYLKKMKK